MSRPSKGKRDFLMTSEVAELLGGVATSTLLKWIKKGYISQCPKTVGGQRHWYIKNLEEAYEYNVSRLELIKSTPKERIKITGHLTTQELADLIGVSRFTILRWLRQGKIKDCKIKGNNGFRYWMPEEIAEVQRYKDDLEAVKEVQ